MDNILGIFEKKYKGGPFLSAETPFQILVATILSAQCTDERVNKVTKVLFKKHNKPEDFVNIKQEELEKLIYSTGFYRAKSKSIIETSKKIINDFGGKVPTNMEDLISLRGVARKTANIVLSQGFNKNYGIAVDTHVKRVSYRLGLSEHKNPNKVEKDLMNIFPREKWKEASWLIIEHGRAYCKAPVPSCSSCFLKDLCPKKGVTKYK
jgi:endonuclease-3|tara:strand:- start:475 stop:1098 length:624 start_codon:yes stop_codon:yes gene_type:complete